MFVFDQSIAMFVFDQMWPLLNPDFPASPVSWRSAIPFLSAINCYP
jgi:hypothetical protein